jgi:hypothetical protein
LNNLDHSGFFDMWAAQFSIKQLQDKPIPAHKITACTSTDKPIPAHKVSAYTSTDKPIPAHKIAACTSTDKPIPALFAAA